MPIRIIISEGTVADCTKAGELIADVVAEHLVDSELHPAIRFVSCVLGPFFGPLVGKAIQYVALVAVTILWRPYARIIFVPVIMLYLYAAWFNIWGNQLYVPLFAKLLLRFSGE